MLQKVFVKRVGDALRVQRDDSFNEQGVAVFDRLLRGPTALPW